MPKKARFVRTNSVKGGPPREPRIWPKIDYPAIDALPGLIDVEGHGRWLLTTWSQGVLYGQGAERKSLPELMVLGEVREVLGEVREVLGDA